MSRTSAFAIAVYLIMVGLVGRALTEPLKPEIIPRSQGWVFVTIGERRSEVERLETDVCLGGRRVRLRLLDDADILFQLPDTENQC